MRGFAGIGHVRFLGVACSGCGERRKMLCSHTSRRSAAGASRRWSFRRVGTDPHASLWMTAVETYEARIAHAPPRCLGGRQIATPRAMLISGGVGVLKPNVSLPFRDPSTDPISTEQSEFHCCYRPDRGVP